MAIKHITVNDKDLTTFDKYDGTKQRADARRLLAYDEGVRSVEAGGQHDLTVWYRDCKATHRKPPAGYEIDHVSMYIDDGSPGVAVAMSRTEADA